MDPAPPAPRDPSREGNPESRALDEVMPSWRELLALVGHPSQLPAFLRLCLEGACRHLGLARAALYLPADGGYRREAAWGGGKLPLQAAETDLEAEGALRLPGALLALPDSPPPRREELLSSPWGLLLSLGSRLLVTHRSLQQRHFEARYRGVELEALYDVGLAVSSTLDLERLSEEILIRAVSLLDARSGALYLVHDGEYRLTRSLGGSPPAVLATGDESIEELVARQGGVRPALWPDATHILVAPIELQGSPRGLIMVADRETRRGIAAFRDTDHRTLTLFAHQAATALENARHHKAALEKERLERELELAAEIQLAILPERLPQVEGLELAAWSRPARRVGGDYYDLLPIEGGGIVAVVGDVAGKGVGAALLVSTLHSALHLLSNGQGLDAALFRQLNRYLAGASSANKFVTLLAVEWPGPSGPLRFLNAGHNPGVLVRADGAVELLTSDTLPLGVFEEGSFELQSVAIAAADLLCLYSDGLTEHTSPADVEFGEERLVDILRRSRDEPLAEISGRIERALAEFGAGRPREDDQTLVLLRATR